MSSTAVFDASIILAFILQEKRVSRLPKALLEQATASTVNIAEAQSLLVRKGRSPVDAWADIEPFTFRAEPFTLAQAETAGTLIAQTRSFGLSLGDRSCLALAIDLDLPVYTTDRVWESLQVGVEIHVIR